MRPNTTVSRALPLVALALWGCGVTGTRSVDRKPVADFTVLQSSVRKQVITLDAAQSFATVGTLAKFHWTFGDEATGAPRTDATTPTLQHVYQAAGEYTVTLVVADDKLTESEPVTRTVSVPAINNEAPRAVLQGPSSGAPGVALLFDGSGSTPSADLQTYTWIFGDGTTLSGADKKTATHTWATPGNYKLTLTVSDSLGQSDTAELTVVVGAVGPVAVCNWTPSPALQGVPVQFDGSGSTAPGGATIGAYLWSFGDGSADGNGQKTSHTYNVQATFRPKLTVIDSQNRLHAVNCADVVVGPPPLCDGQYSLTANPNKQPCSFWGQTTWGGNKLNIHMLANGTITADETFQGTPLNYSGTWTGNAFTMTGAYDITDATSGITTHSEVTINGTWTQGCGGWTGTWVEVNSTATLGTLCTLTWNITSSKL